MDAPWEEAPGEKPAPADPMGLLAPVGELQGRRGQGAQGVKMPFPMSTPKGVELHPTREAALLAALDQSQRDADETVEPVHVLV